MIYRELRRRARGKWGQILAVGLWVLLVLLLATFAFRRVASVEEAAGGAGTWAHHALAFYDAMLPVVAREAGKMGAARIQIHPLQNSTNTLCSAPCNEGLAQAICEQNAHLKPPTVPEVIFWNQPPALRAPGEALLRSWGSIPDQAIFRGAGLYAGWYLGDSRGASRHVDQPGDGKPTLHLTIHIEQIVLDFDGKIFQAQFDLYGGPSADAQARLAPHACQGDLAQIRWFTRTRSNRTWRYTVNTVAFSALAMVLLVLLIPRVRKKLDDFVEARISIRCTAIGAVFGFVLLVLTPVGRDQVGFYERANLFYVLDRNSEIWLPEDVSRREKGIAYLAERLENDINREVVNPPAARGKSFLGWLWQEGLEKGWVPIYEPRRYSLNSPFVLEVFGFSGTPSTSGQGRTDWISLGIGGSGVVKQAVQGGVLAPELSCVARQLCPQAETELVKVVQRSRESNQQRMPPSFVLLLTSQCESSRKGHREFIDSFPRARWEGSENAGDQDRAVRERCTNMHVFTVLVPSLPRSGSGWEYDYADGKYLLSSLFSEAILDLNAPADPTWLADLRSLQRSWSGRLPPPCRPGNVGVERITLRSPLFDLRGLSSSHRDYWDQPRDLAHVCGRRAVALERAGGGAAPAPAENNGGAGRDYRLLTSPEAIETASQEVAERFREFVTHPDRLKTIKSVHVIGPTPWPYWLMAVGAALFLGAWAFCLQYDNHVYRRELNRRGWRNLATAQWLHRGTPLVVLLFMFVFLFVILWQSEDPQVWTSSGDPAWAFCAGVLFWICWVVAPHVYFRRFEELQSASGAGWQTVAFAAGFALLMLAVHVVLPSGDALWRWCKFGVTVAAAGVAAAYCLRKIDVYESHASKGEVLAWWRRPVWSGLLISALTVLLITLLRGALPAGPIAGEGFLARAGNVVLARLDFIAFVALSVFLVSLIGFGIAFTQDERWSWKRIVFWSVPLAAAVGSIVLLIL